MDLRHLRYFLAVADAGQMTAAAASLAIQQPPLSQQIRALEHALGLQLFLRHPKGMTLTDAGRSFEAEARRLVEAFDAMQRRMQALARGEQGWLQLAFTSSAAAHAFIPKALRACRRRFPDISWTIAERNAAEITEAVADGRLHCGLLRVQVAQPPGVLQHELLREPVVVALPSDHALARKARIAPEDLHDAPLILVRRPGAPGLYANLLALCHARGAVPRVVAEVERMMSNLNLVAAGVGLSIVPASMQHVHRDVVTYRPLARGVSLHAPLTVVYRADRLQGALQTFVGLLAELAAADETGAAPASAAAAPGGP
jgi:DNA-binding transcriptional LysR family regulator